VHRSHLTAALLGALLLFGWSADAQIPTAADIPTDPDSALDPDLALCETPGAAAEFEQAVTLFASTEADRLASDEAKGLASALTDGSKTLRQQLDDIEPAHADFVSAWQAFESVAKSSGLGRSDRVLRMFLPGYGRTERELATQLGCNDDPEFGSSLCPCPAIPLAHQLAELGLQLHTYVAGRYAEGLPEAVPAADGLDKASATLHDLLHAIEITIPELQRNYAALETELGDAQAEVFERVRSTFEALDGLVGRCQLNPEAAMAGMTGMGDGDGATEHTEAEHTDHSEHEH